MDELRACLLPRAAGDVLELGVGTGATFAHDPPGLQCLTALDLSGAMLDRARPLARSLPFPVRLLQGDFETLPFGDASFDSVGSSLGLCGVPDPPRLFTEVRRVLRPDGQRLALEHVRPPNRWLAAAADLIDPAFDRLVGGHSNRPTTELLRVSGFGVQVLERRLTASSSRRGRCLGRTVTPGARSRRGQPRT